MAVVFGVALMAFLMFLLCLTPLSDWFTVCDAMDEGWQCVMKEDNSFYSHIWKDDCNVCLVNLRISKEGTLQEWDAINLTKCPNYFEECRELSYYDTKCLVEGLDCSDIDASLTLGTMSCKSYRDAETKESCEIKEGCGEYLDVWCEPCWYLTVAGLKWQNRCPIGNNETGICYYPNGTWYIDKDMESDTHPKYPISRRRIVRSSAFLCKKGSICALTKCGHLIILRLHPLKRWTMSGGQRHEASSAAEDSSRQQPNGDDLDDSFGRGSAADSKS